MLLGGGLNFSAPRIDMARFPRSRQFSVFAYVVIFVLVLLAILGLYMVNKGAVNYKRIAPCTQAPPDSFCGIEEIDLAVPDELRTRILEIANTDAGKRVVIPQWKAGRTIDTQSAMRLCPDLFTWYKGLEGKISKIIGEKVYTTSPDLPTTCAVLVYEQEGDFIHWHYDVNYFNGRFFTLIIPCTFTDTCTEYTYYDKNDQLQSLKNVRGKSILFEGDKVFHMATKFCDRGGQKRTVISVQFSTDPTISWYNRILMRIKDIAYIG